MNIRRSSCLFCLCLWGGMGTLAPLNADDYFVTIGGGPRPAANQASLEANVLFVQSILKRTSDHTVLHEIYFADGADPDADLQVLASPSTDEKPAGKSAQDSLRELFTALHRQNRPSVAYRSHTIQPVAGPSDPDLIADALSRIGRVARQGDRLIIYVTAHGGSADQDRQTNQRRAPDQYNTSIYHWNGRILRMHEFRRWLDQLPADLPVLMVMAQCYCGGFAHSIFASSNDETQERLDDDSPQDSKDDDDAYDDSDADLDEGAGEEQDRDASDEKPRLHPALRTGFFAQQHDLPAAGCRPDIENDDEFSSFFWGALIGRTRTGDPLPQSDLNGDGQVSFDEAYAAVVVHSPTIDIPLRASDVLLQTFSSLEIHPSNSDRLAETEDVLDAPESTSWTSKTLDEVVQLAQSQNDFVAVHIIRELSLRLGFPLSDRMEQVRKRYDAQRRQGRVDRRGGRSRGRSGRSALLEEVKSEWPELADRRNWSESRWLGAEECDDVWEKIQTLPSYAVYEKRRLEREARSARNLKNELQEVQFRRLLDQLEVVGLAQHLPQLADGEIVTRYHEMRALEGTFLAPQHTKKQSAKQQGAK